MSELSAVIKVSLKFVTQSIPDMPCFESLTGEYIKTFGASAVQTSPGKSFISLSYDKESSRDKSIF